MAGRRGELLAKRWERKHLNKANSREATCCTTLASTLCRISFKVRCVILPRRNHSRITLSRSVRRDYRSTTTASIVLHQVAETFFSAFLAAIEFSPGFDIADSDSVVSIPVSWERNHWQEGGTKDGNIDGVGSAGEGDRVGVFALFPGGGETFAITERKRFRLDIFINKHGGNETTDFAG